MPLKALFLVASANVSVRIAVGIISASSVLRVVSLTYELRHKKTSPQGFRRGKTTQPVQSQK